MDNEVYKLIPIEVGELIPSVIRYKIDGWRMMQACSVSLGENFELSYSFTRGYEMEILRLCVPKTQHIPSISHVFECAFLYENEMAELFGVPIDMISTDYHGKLYRIEQEAPFKERG